MKNASRDADQDICIACGDPVADGRLWTVGDVHACYGCTIAITGIDPDTGQLLP